MVHRARKVSISENLGIARERLGRNMETLIKVLLAFYFLDLIFSLVNATKDSVTYRRSTFLTIAFTRTLWILVFIWVLARNW